MNLIRIAALVGVAVLASPAAFAEEGARIPALSNWSGFYAGVTAGGALFNGSAITETATFVGLLPAPPNSVPVNGSSSSSSSTPGSNNAGFTSGALIGYNYQIGTVVLGAETDFNYLGLKSQGTASTSFPLGAVTIIPGAGGVTQTLSIAAHSAVDWFGTVRLRLGLAPAERILLYATGGLAYAKVATSELDSNILTTGASSFWQGNSSELKLGWTLGAGVDYALTPQVAVRAEYLYVDIGKSSAVAGFQDVARLPFTDLWASHLNYAVSHDNRFSIARVAVSYKF